MKLTEVIGQLLQGGIQPDAILALIAALLQSNEEEVQQVVQQLQQMVQGGQGQQQQAGPSPDEAAMAEQQAANQNLYGSQGY